jgi:hypothetical protein
MEIDGISAEDGKGRHKYFEMHAFGELVSLSFGLRSMRASI